MTNGKVGLTLELWRRFGGAPHVREAAGLCSRSVGVLTGFTVDGGAAHA